MKRKILSLILVTSAVVMMFTGCGEKTADATTETSGSSESKDYGETSSSSGAVSEEGESSGSDSKELYNQMTLDEYIKGRNLADLSLYGIEKCNADTLESYSEVDTDVERNNFYRTQIAREIIGGYESGIYAAYNPANYSGTLDMFNEMCSDFKDCMCVNNGTTDLMPEESDLLQRSDDAGNGSVSNDQIASAIDAFSNELGASVLLVTILPYDKVTFYFNNGLVYYIGSVEANQMFFTKSYCLTNETDDAPYVYRCDYQGNIEITSAK